ncbi:hypothetical protein NCW_01183 [Burkholderia pseudomallei]
MDEGRHNAGEREAIGVCISVEAIDDMVNYALLQLIDVSQCPGECETRFHATFAIQESLSQTAGSGG